jgi:hypothetical protein
MLCVVRFGLFSLPADARSNVTHGLWVWKSSSVLEAPRGAETLLRFCQAEDINEVYVSVSQHDDASMESRFARLIVLLHRSKIRVQALLSSENADEAGKHREKLLSHVREIVQFNRVHPAERFDGIHLDIEPQQRPENKGPGNLRFFPGLVDAYRAVLAEAEPARLTVDADIQTKVLKADLAERQMLLSSVPHLTLMLYELSSPDDGEPVEKKIEKLRTTSQKFLVIAYEGLGDQHLADMVIALRTQDYGELLPRMLSTLDEANASNPHFRGWAIHSYNDSLQATN